MPITKGNIQKDMQSALESLEQIFEGEIVRENQAIAYGELYALPMGYPAMIIGKSQVHGYLLTFRDDSILESLDELEDYQSDRTFGDNLYNRQQIEVFDFGEKSLGLAWGYFMTLEQVTKFGGIVQSDGLWIG